MTFRERLALHLAPWPLRLALGATFIWVGLGKIDAYEPAKPEDRAALVEMGVLLGESRPASTEPKLEAKPDSKPLPKAETKDEPKPDPKPSAPPPPLKKDGPTAWLDNPETTDPHAPRIVRTAQAATPKVEELVRRMHPSIAMRVYRASRGEVPGVEAPKEPTKPWIYWPAFLGKGAWPMYQAWMVSLTEMIGGALVLVGLFTRLASVMLVFVMLGAMWLTQIGPAIASGQTVLGVLPNHDAYDVRAWMPFFWQLALMGGALALTLSGAGSLSLDRWLGGSRDDDDPEDFE
jgi:uncharacterized membrane protein YphA (DoxX/SURF4 family)